MDIAVLSDIHGNHAAFRACLDYAFSHHIDTFIFLGDYLGEFAYPQKTMEMLYKLQQHYTCYFVKGNKEDYWLNRYYDRNCDWKDGNHTVGAMLYCYANLTKRDIDFFEALSPSLRLDLEGLPTLLACHGSPRKNTEKMLHNTPNTYQIMDSCDCPYILCGHTHLRGITEYNGKKAINPGAVGVPMYSDGKTQFMILHADHGSWSHTFITLEYDREQALSELKTSGLTDCAPYWTQITEHLIRTGKVSHGEIITRAMELCVAENGSGSWSAIPDKFWVQAIEERLV